MGAGDEWCQIGDETRLVRILQQHAEGGRAVGCIECHGCNRQHMDVDPQRFRPAADHVDRLREAPVADQKARAFACCFLLGSDAVQQRHRLGRRRGFVQQRRVRDLHPRQIRDHRLEVDERLQSTLGDLGLIRRVGRVPARVLHHHPQDDAWRDRVVVAEADVGAEDLVAGGDLCQPPKILMFTLRRRKAQRPRQPDGRRDCLVDERVKRAGADRLQHRVALVCGGPDVAGGKPVGGVERAHQPRRP